MPTPHSAHRLDQPRVGRSRRVTSNAEALGRVAERAARFLGTSRYLVIQTIMVAVSVVCRFWASRISGAA